MTEQQPEQQEANSTFASRRAERAAAIAEHGAPARRSFALRAGDNADNDVVIRDVNDTEVIR